VIPSFLLVSLNIDAILGEITLHQRRKKLDEMTKGESLGHAYAATLSRVKTQQKSRSKLGMEVLMWVSHTERPLHVDELCHALGVEEGSIDLNIRNIPAIETLLACTLGLVTVEKSSSTVRLIHYTLQEYLSHNPSLFPKSHSMIAEVCLTYLNFRRVKDFSPTLRSIPPTIPFVNYASCYWGMHAWWETTERVKRLALELLDEYDKHISSKILLLYRMKDCDRPLDQEGSPRGFSGLHGAAYFGCEEITTALLKVSKWNARATDFNGNTAIAWAARRGHEGVVRILLERSDSDPNTPDAQYGRTPLSWAAGNGNEKMVAMLLERNDVDLDTTDYLLGRTPLWWAAESGHEGVVGMLLERSNINPNTPDTLYGQTPLSWAARGGHVGVVKTLLDRNDVDPNKTDNQLGRTPLSWAAERGNEGVVRILLERSNIDPNTPDTICGQTPLSWAAEKGHKGVVAMLIERNDVDPDTADNEFGRTPLLWAAKNGNESVVRILLERSEVNPNIADTRCGQTPLSLAAENGREGVVRVLLERKDINPNTPDNEYGRTPLSWAVGNGHREVVGMLLGRSDVDPNKVDTKYGETPLKLALWYGYERIVRLLRERMDFIPRHAASLQLAEPFSPEPSGLSEPPSKRARRS